MRLTQSELRWPHHQCELQSVAVSKMMCLESHRSAETLLGQRGKFQGSWDYAKSAEYVSSSGKEMKPDMNAAHAWLQD